MSKTPTAAVRGWHIVNAEEQHARQPETFELPTLEQRRKLEPNDQAKVIFVGPTGSSERIWLSIVAVKEGPVYEGFVANEPVAADLPEYGKDITFLPVHVVDIVRPGLPVRR